MNKFYWMVIGLLLGLGEPPGQTAASFGRHNMVLQQATKALPGNATPNSSFRKSVVLGTIRNTRPK